MHMYRYIKDGVRVKEEVLPLWITRGATTRNNERYLLQSAIKEQREKNLADRYHPIGVFVDLHVSWRPQRLTSASCVGEAAVTRAFKQNA